MTADFSYVGMEGRVILAVPADGMGEVEVRSPRGIEVLFARTAPGKSIDRGARVLIVDYHGGRHADVAEWDLLAQLIPNSPQGDENNMPAPAAPASGEVYNPLDLEQPGRPEPEG